MSLQSDHDTPVVCEARKKTIFIFELKEIEEEMSRKYCELHHVCHTSDAQRGCVCVREKRRRESRENDGGGDGSKRNEE